MIEVKNLSKSYGNKGILTNINFAIPRGQSVAIVGKSGAGKSILLKCLIGLVKPNFVTIYLDNKLINSMNFRQLQEIRSRIKGREGVKILNIVEEGYQVTPEDVDAGLVLVELDKAALIDQQLNQEIAVETAEATYIERRAEYEIQLNENMTALNDARQEMRFARLEFEKFLGGNLVSGIIAQLEIEERLAKAEAEDLEAMSRSLPSSRNSIEEAAEERAPRPVFDPADLNSMPPPVRERIEQMMAENGGELPPEMVERMQQFAQGGFPGGGPFSGRRQGRGVGGASSAPSPVAGDGPVIAEAPELRPVSYTHLTLPTKA